jgi:hypothetical protein
MRQADRQLALVRVSFSGLRWFGITERQRPKFERVSSAVANIFPGILKLVRSNSYVALAFAAPDRPATTAPRLGGNRHCSARNLYRRPNEYVIGNGHAIVLTSNAAAAARARAAARSLGRRNPCTTASKLLSLEDVEAQNAEFRTAQYPSSHSVVMISNADAMKTIALGQSISAACWSP